MESKSSKHYTIDLSRIGDTRVKLESELRSDDQADEIIELYLGDSDTPRDPLEGNKLEEVGQENIGNALNPTYHILYDFSEDGKIIKSNPHEQLIQDLENQGIEIKDYPAVKYGTEMGTFIPTPEQIFKYPKTSARSLSRAVVASKSKMGLDSEIYNGILKNTKAWLACIRKMWGKVLQRMDTESSTMATEGMEASNGLYLYYSLIKARTHTEQLATILGLLTSVKLLPSVKTGSRTAPETCKQLFQRVRRMARDALSFPAMTHAIPEPVLKVWTIHGLLRSNKSKYKQFAADALKADLTDSWAELLKNAETAEGNRIEEIIEEYAPNNTAHAQVQLAKTDVVDLVEFRKKVDSLPKKPATNNKSKSVYTKKGICYHYTRTGRCRFGSKCRFKHLISEHTAYKERNADVSPAEAQDKDDARFKDSDDARFKETTTDGNTASPSYEDPFAFIASDDDTNQDFQ